MANKVLNWGLLSTARINRALIPPLQVSKRNELLAVASRTQEAADRYARAQNIPRASFELIRQSLKDGAAHCDEAREMLRKLREVAE